MWWWTSPFLNTHTLVYTILNSRTNRQITYFQTIFFFVDFRSVHRSAHFWNEQQMFSIRTTSAHCRQMSSCNSFEQNMLIFFSRKREITCVCVSRPTDDDIDRIILVQRINEHMYDCSLCFSGGRVWLTNIGRPRHTTKMRRYCCNGLSSSWRGGRVETNVRVCARVCWGEGEGKGGAKRWHLIYLFFEFICPIERIARNKSERKRRILLFPRSCAPRVCSHQCPNHAEKNGVSARGDRMAMVLHFHFKFVHIAYYSAYLHAITLIRHDNGFIYLIAAGGNHTANDSY